MGRGLSTLLQGLLGGAAGGFQGYAQGQMQKRDKAERDEERRAAKEQQDRLFKMQQDAATAVQTDRERGYAKDAWLMASPEDDLTTNPLLGDMEKFGFGLKTTAPVIAPKIADSFTLPSLPGSAGPASLDAPPSTPMSGAKYDPTAPPEDEPEIAAAGGIPKPLPMGGPITVGVPTYGLGAPGKTTRTETRQESQQRIQREAMLSTFKATLADPRAKDPAVRAMIEGQIRQLEQGADPTMSESELVTSLRLGNQPTAGADKDIIDPRVRGELAAALKTDPSMIPERWSQLPSGAHDAYAAWEKKNRGVNPQPIIMGGNGGDGLTPQQQTAMFRIGSALRSDITYRDMVDVNTGYIGVNQGLEQRNGLGDIAAINAFQRMVDPGATVREGDVALIQKASSVANRILSDYPIQRLRDGAMLPDVVREQMRVLANELYARRAKNYNDSTGGRYRKQAEAVGIPFELVGEDFAVPEFDAALEADIAKVIAGGYTREEAIAHFKQKGRIK